MKTYVVIDAGDLLSLKVTGNHVVGQGFTMLQQIIGGQLSTYLTADELRQVIDHLEGLHAQVAKQEAAQ